MSTTRIVGIILVVAGILALAYGGFSYTKANHSTSVGPFSFSIKEKESVNVPVWAGVAGVVVGAALLLVPKRG